MERQQRCRRAQSVGAICAFLIALAFVASVAIGSGYRPEVSSRLMSTLEECFPSRYHRKLPLPLRTSCVRVRVNIPTAPTRRRSSSYVVQSVGRGQCASIAVGRPGVVLGGFVHRAVSEPVATTTVVVC
uniref:Uncharacterized protein n=1 Tax=Anopheles farauti TaxID=69004 RepID=A0A182Q2C0_9DIPT